MDDQPVPEKKWRQKVVARWTRLDEQWGELKKWRGDLAKWCKGKDAEDQALFALIRKFHPEIALGGVEPRVQAPPPAPQAGAKYEQSTDLQIKGPSIKFSSKKKLAIGAGSLGGVGMIVLVLLFGFGKVKPWTGAPTGDIQTVTEYVPAPGAPESAAFVRNVMQDDASKWNLTEAQRDLGEDALAALGGE